MLRHRRRAIAEGRIDDGSDAEGDFIFKGRATICTPMGSPSGERSNRNDCGGRGQRVEPLRVTHGVKVLDRRPSMVQRALAVTERGNAGDRAEQNGKRAHLFERLRAQQVELGPCVRADQSR